jgi:hypothetical protein
MQKTSIHPIAPPIILEHGSPATPRPSGLQRRNATRSETLQRAPYRPTNSQSGTANSLPESRKLQRRGRSSVVATFKRQAKRESVATHGIQAPAQRAPAPGRNMVLATDTTARDHAFELAQERLNQWAMRHTFGLSSASKSAFFGTWAISASGMSTQTVTTLTSMGEAMFPFAVLSVVGALFEVYSTTSDTKHARRDYVVARSMLCDMQAVRKELDDAQAFADLSPGDRKKLVELIDLNIKALSAFTAAFEKNYLHRSSQGVRTSMMTADLDKCAREISKGQAEVRKLDQRILALETALEDFKGGGKQKTDPEYIVVVNGIRELDIQRKQIQANCEQLHKDAQKLLSRSAMRSRVREQLTEKEQALSDAEAQLTSSKASLEAMEQELSQAEARQILAQGLTDWAEATQHVHDHERQIDDLKKKIEALSHGVQGLKKEVDGLKDAYEALSHKKTKMLLNPYSELAPSEVKYVRSTRLLLPKAFVDLGSAASGLSLALGVADAFLGAATLGITSAFLSVLIGQIDLQDAAAEKASATAAKLSALAQAINSAELVKACAEDKTEEDVASLMPIARSHMRCMERVVNDKHAAGNQADKREHKGTGLTISGSVAAVMGTTAAAVLTPAIAILGATLLVLVGAGYYSTVAARNYSLHLNKESLKARAVIADTFICLFGTQGVEQFARDRIRGQGNLWDKRIQEMQMLLAQHNPDLPAKYLTPDALFDNEFLSIERAAHHLHVRAREHGVGGPPDNMTLLIGSLAAAGKKTDPSKISIQPGESAVDHQDRLRMALCDIYQVKDYEEKRLPKALDKPQSVELATAVNDALEQAFGQSPINSYYLKELARALADEPDSLDSRLHAMGADARTRLRAYTATVRQALGRLGIGPHELHAMQRQIRSGESRILDGPLQGDAGPYLLELLADPSWLEPLPVAPTKLVVPPLTRATAAVGVVKAMKAVGREMRDGPLPVKDIMAIKTAQEKAKRPETDPISTRKRLRRSIDMTGSNVGLFLDGRSRSISKHLKRKLPNPMGTPNRTLKLLDRERNDVLRSQHISRLIEVFLKEIYPSGEMPMDPDVMKDVKNPDDEMEVKYRHALALLNAANTAFLDAALWQGQQPDMDQGSPTTVRHSKSHRYMSQRLEENKSVCELLKDELKLGWWEYQEETKKHTDARKYAELQILEKAKDLEDATRAFEVIRHMNEFDRTMMYKRNPKRIMGALDHMRMKAPAAATV